MTTLILVRHGQSEANLARRFAGHSDISLTELGYDQARDAAEFLRDYPIDVIYASDLRRALQTAEPTAELFGKEIIPDRELREIYAGDWEMVPYDRLMVDFAQDYSLWRTDLGHAHPTNGESVLELAKRVSHEIDRIVERHRGECIAIFSHYTPIRAMLCKWAGEPFENMQVIEQVHNGSVTVATLADGAKWEIRVRDYVKNAREEEARA